MITFEEAVKAAEKARSTKVDHCIEFDDCYMLDSKNDEFSIGGRCQMVAIMKADGSAKGIFAYFKATSKTWEDAAKEFDF